MNLRYLQFNNSLPLLEKYNEAVSQLLKNPEEASITSVMNYSRQLFLKIYFQNDFNTVVANHNYLNLLMGNPGNYLHLEDSKLRGLDLFVRISDEGIQALESIDAALDDSKNQNHIDILKHRRDVVELYSQGKIDEGDGLHRSYLLRTEMKKKYRDPKAIQMYLSI